MRGFAEHSRKVPLIIINNDINFWSRFKDSIVRSLMSIGPCFVPSSLASINKNSSSSRRMPFQRGSSNVLSHNCHHESFPHMPPELWCSPSAKLSNDWTVISRALKNTTPPIENAMKELR